MRKSTASIFHAFLKRVALDVRGAIDLASIMVGVIVIGVIGGVIATNVFVVVPWAQDEAAKAELQAVQLAQSVAQVREQRFIDIDELIEKGYLAAAPTSQAASDVSAPIASGSTPMAAAAPASPGLGSITDAEGTCYVAVSTSDSGSVFYTTSESPDVYQYEEGASNTDWCVSLSGLISASASSLCTVTASDEAEIRAAFSEATDGEYICLGNNVVNAGTNASTSLSVPASIGVTLDLSGFDLTTTASSGRAGISVVSGSTFTVVDTSGSGTLDATGDTSGIGATSTSSTAGTINIDSGIVRAKGTGSSATGIGGTGTGAGGIINITGGDVLATSNQFTVTGLHAGAGIGGGATGGASGQISISDAVVVAPSIGSYAGALNSVIIDNSEVTTTVNIGGNSTATGTISIINGSVVNARSSQNSAAIGGTGSYSGVDITIEDSTVTASHDRIGGSNASAATIGGGYRENSGNITIRNSIVEATMRDYELTSQTSVSSGAAIGSGDAATSSALGVIVIDNSTVIARGAGGAGIGGATTRSGATISIINSSHVTATSNQGAAIGGGGGGTSVGGAGGTINITSGSVVNASAIAGAGIGGGGQLQTSSSNGGAGGSITIADATVNAVSVGGAGIGGGNRKGAAGSITITDSVINASSTGGGAGIGTSSGGTAAASIGSWPGSAGGTIDISGSQITASGTFGTGGGASTSGAAIGSGNRGAPGSAVTITASDIVATTGNGGDGINGGTGTPGSVVFSGGTLNGVAR